MRRANLTSALVLASSLLLAACAPGKAGEDDAHKPRLGLFTSLPIYWGEGDIATLLDGDGQRDWVREELEARFELVPLDTLESDAIAGLDRILLAQPRPLAPSENLAFDEWVAKGGDTVIFADPMLTRHSIYPIGDRRRAQDVALISPILGRWGLELQMDESQPGGERIQAFEGESIPVNLAGSFASSGPSPVAKCTVAQPPVAARCTRGAGNAWLFADAAIFDWDGKDPVPDDRKQALRTLLTPLAR